MNHARVERARVQLALSLIGWGLSGLAWAQQAPTVSLAELPQLLKDQWQAVAPEMTDTSRCAAAFDSKTDPFKMILKCSIYIRSASEGARRAMRYCEDDRARLGVRGPCRVVERR